jgi:hypothetical protein
VIPREIKRRRLALVLTIVIFLAASIGPRPADAARVPAGSVEMVVPVAVAVRDGKQFDLQPGSEIYEFDYVLTGHMGSAVVKLNDGTVVELGPEAGISVVNYVFSVDTALLQLNLERGGVNFKLLGGIGLKNPKGIRLVTPKSLITASNADISVATYADTETAVITRLPKGQSVTFYSTQKKDVVELKYAGSTVVTDAAGDMTVYLPGEAAGDGKAEIKQY